MPLRPDHSPGRVGNASLPIAERLAASFGRKHKKRTGQITAITAHKKAWPLGSAKVKVTVSVWVSPFPPPRHATFLNIPLWPVQDGHRESVTFI